MAKFAKSGKRKVIGSASSPAKASRTSAKRKVASAAKGKAKAKKQMAAFKKKHKKA